MTMHAALVALVLAIWTHMHATGPDAARIAEAIATAVERETSPASGESIAVDAALLAVYAKHESGLSEHPIPFSWDARAGLSCGFLQLRCYLVTGRSLETQATTWLDSMRRAGLGLGVDSSPSRAQMRLERAREALSDVLMGEPAGD